MPLFEACVAVGGFVLWIALFESVHLWLPNAQEHRLDKQLPERPLQGFAKDWHKTVVPAVTYLLSIYLYKESGLATFLFGVKPAFDEAPSYVRLITEVSMGVVLYDLFFYPFHYSFHAAKSSGSWRKQHTRHHRWGGQERHAHNAVETVQNSYLDAGIQVSINILVQNLSPWGFGAKHPLSRVLHNLMVTYLLSEAHSGYDLPFQSHRLFPAVFGGSVRHEEHHQVGNVCYHQFFKYLDDARGLGPRALPPDSAYRMWTAAQVAQAARVNAGQSGSSAAPGEAGCAPAAYEPPLGAVDVSEAARELRAALLADDESSGTLPSLAAAEEATGEAGGAAGGARKRTLEEMITAKRAKGGYSALGARRASGATAREE